MVWLCKLLLNVHVVCFIGCYFICLPIYGSEIVFHGELGTQFIV